MLDSLLVPAAEKKSPWLMVVLHGLGDSLAGFRWLPDALGLPWLNYRLVNAPDHYFGGYSWYDFAGDPAPGIVRSRAELTALLDQQIEAGFPAERIFLLGFSQGCLMTLEMGMKYSKILAGCVGISGYVYEPDQAVKKFSPVATRQRLLVTHGTRDPLIPIEKVRPQIQVLKAAGLALTWKEFVKEHTIAGEEEIEVIRDFVVKGRGDGGGV